MITSEATTNLFKAMIEAAPEIQSISKSKQAYGYKYATLDSLIDMLRAALPKHGLWFAQMPTRSSGKSALTTRVFHVSGEWMEDSIEMTDTELQGKANDTQKVGASITYFRRYALSSIFGVAADEDVDGNIATKSAPRPTTKTESKPSENDGKRARGFIRTDFDRRVANGEDEGSILSDYSNLLQLDRARKLDEYDGKQLKDLANALYRRARQ